VNRVAATGAEPTGRPPDWDTDGVPGSHLDLVREGYERWNSGDREWILQHMDPEVEWITPPNDPDPGTHQGHEGVEGFWDEWRAAVGQLQLEPEEYIEAGDHVLVVARRVGKGEHSGIEIADRVVQVFTFRPEDGKCVRVREFYDRAEALGSVDAEVMRTEPA
jgi:ketosteroid isomerase-like protein